MTTRAEGRSAARNEQSRTAFGLKLQIDPDISIPGLGEGVSPGAETSPTYVHLNPEGLAQRWAVHVTPPMRARELHFEGELVLSVDFADSAGYLLWAKEFGRVLISPDGRELLCEADPVNEDWPSILAAQALPLAATIRGLEVFHASGVVLDGGALLFAGPPGSGKSSLAAALVRSGAQLMSDDAVALELRGSGLLAHAGSIAIQLRASEDDRLSEEERAALGHPTASSTGKHRYVAARMPEPAPLRGLFLLERSADEPAVEPLAAVDPFELIASTFNLSVRTPARLRRQLDVVSAIASSGLAHRLRVQPGIGAAELAGIIQSKLALPIA